MRKENYKNADYPNKIPFYAYKHPQYLAFNKLTGFPNEQSMKSTAKYLKSLGNKVIIEGDYLYWKKRDKSKSPLKNTEPA